MGPSRQEKYASLKATAVKQGSKFLPLSLPKSQVTGELHYRLDGAETADKLIVFIHGE